MNNQFNQQNGLFNDGFLDMMAVIGFAISIYNLMLNEQQLSNDDVAREVQVNRGKLDEQNDKYLETIIEQNNKIINLLERR
jgi:hypothetical protein